MSDIGQEDFRVELEGGKYVAIRLVGGGTRWLRHDEHWEAATQDWQYAKAINCLIDELHEARTKKGDAAAIGQRAAHYGSGVQPWDNIKAAGWGPEFAAGNALKYVRRFMNKNGDDDIAKGRWYYHALIEMVVEAREANDDETNTPFDHADNVFVVLELMLTQDERALLRIRKEGVS